MSDPLGLFTSSDPLGLFQTKKKEKTSLTEDLAIGFAGLGNTVDTAWSMLAGGLADKFSTDEADKVYKNLDERIKSRNEWAGGQDKEQGFGGKALAAIPQIPAFPFSPFDTGKSLIDAGESLKTARRGAAIDTLGNVAGVAIPGSMGTKAVTKGATGFAINAAQDTAVKQAISSIAETEQAKQQFAPTLESAALAGVIGGGFAMATPSAKRKPKEAPKLPVTDMEAILDAKKNPEPVLSPEDAFWKERAGKMQRNDQQAALLEAAIAKQPQSSNGPLFVDQRGQARNWEQDAQDQAARNGQPMVVSPEGQAYVNSPEVELARRNAENIAAQVEGQIKAEQANWSSMPEQMKAIKQQLGDVDFWRQRALQLQQQAQAALPKPPEVIRASQEGIAGDVPTMEGLARSTEGITYENVPPDAVIPRDAQFFNGERDKPMLTVPRGNNWQVDENGIPVRQGIAESTVAPDYINRYMRQDEAVRNDMGNAIQEANGPKLGADQTFGSEPLDKSQWGKDPVNKTVWSGSRFGQGGGVNANMLHDMVDGLRNIWGKVNDSVKFPISEKSIQEKDSTIRKLKALGETLPEWAPIQTFEEAITKIQEHGKDINSTKIGAQTASGLGMMGAWHKHPLLNYAKTLMRDARHQVSMFSHNYLTGKDGVAQTMLALSPEDKIAVTQLSNLLDKKQMDFDADIGSSVGLSPEAIKYMEAKKAALDAEWEWRGKIAAARGEILPNRRRGYSPSVFNGQFKSLVFDEKGDVVGVIGAESAGEFMLAKQYFAEKNPGAKFSADTPQKARRALGGDERTAFKYQNLSEIIRMLSSVDGDFAKIQNTVELDALKASQDIFGFNVHNLKKKGVEGNLGNKPWLDAKKNAEQRLEADVRFLEQAAEHHSLQRMGTELRQLAADPSTEGMPKAKEVLDNYYKNISGSNLHIGGKVLNWAMDNATKVLDMQGKYGSAHALRMSNNVKNYMAMHYMGFFNVMFAASQLMQPMQTGIPVLSLVAGRTGMSQAQVSKSFMSGGMSFLASKMNNSFGKDVLPVNPLHKEALDWAQKNGILDFSELEHVYAGTKSKAERAIQKAGEFSMQFAEENTRPPMFLAFVDMLSKTGADKDTVFKTAENLTAQAMVDYHKWERPLVYQGFGVLSPHVGGLTTFKHNYLGTQALLAREMKKNPAPALMSLMAISSLAGIIGLPFYDDINEMLYKPAREYLTGEKKSISQDFLNNLPMWMKSGILSDMIDLNIQGKFSSANMIPDSPTKALFPHLSGAADIAGAATKAATSPNETTLSNLAVAATPSGFKEATKYATKRDEEGWLLDKKGQRDVQRTDEEWKRSAITGLAPNKEAEQKRQLWENKQTELARKDRLKGISTSFKESVMADDWDGANNALAEWQDMGGDPQVLIKNLEKILIEKEQGSLEKARGIPSNAEGVRRYNAY